MGRAGGGCLVAHGFWGAHGENYPNKAVTLVVTAAPGGVTDILARALGQRLGKIWGNNHRREQPCRKHVRFWPIADIRVRTANVRFQG
jgi:tripartite-type tricarboxylate transporter receptor subunit TctC